MMDTSTPVLLLGGKENCLSVTRHLGRLGIPVRVSGAPNAWGMYSRYCTERLPVPRGMTQAAYWRDLLLGADEKFNGHILLAMSDAAIEFLLEHRDALGQRYILDDTNPQLQRDLMDKQRTLELGAMAGVGVPRHWTITDDKSIGDILPEVRLPAMVKPLQSHKFAEVFGCKLFIVETDKEDLRAKAALAWSRGIAVMIVEMIPGPDDLLSSYYTYMDARGRKLFRYTKRIIRRWPVNQGNACYHANDWLPETAAAGEKLLDAIGYRGIANVEFKRDTRDGKLKLIEVNSRITAAQELPVRAGVPIDLIIYLHLTGQKVPVIGAYREDLRLWHPLRDFLAFLQLRRKYGMTFMQWLKSVATTKNIFPLASLRDPMPILGAALAVILKVMAD